MDFDISQFRKQFIKEAKELLYKVELFLSALKIEPDNKGIIKNTYRSFHTIKGTSAMYGFETLSEYSETLESIYKAILNDEFLLTQEIIEITHPSINHIRNLLLDAEFVNDDNRKQHELLTNQIDVILSSLKINFNKTANVVHYEIFEEDEDIATNNSEKTYHILINLDKEFSKTGIKLDKIYNELATKGELKVINGNQIKENKEQNIAVFLVSKLEIKEIEYVFLFLDDETTITEICDFNIFDTPINLNELAFSSQRQISEKLLPYIK